MSYKHLVGQKEQISVCEQPLISLCLLFLVLCTLSMFSAFSFIKSFNIFINKLI